MKAEARLAAGFWNNKCRALDPAFAGMTPRQRPSLREGVTASLDLAFLVHHVLANDGVVLLDLHLVRRVLLVLVGGVEVAGVGRGDQADLVALGSHDSDPPSDLLAALAQIGQDGIDAVLVDSAQGSRGKTQLHPAVFAGDPEPALMQVREETAAGLVHCVRDVVAGRRTLAGYLANSGHTHLERYLMLPLAREAAAPPPAMVRGGSRFGSGFVRCRRREGIVVPVPPGHGQLLKELGRPDAASRALCTPAPERGKSQTGKTL